MVKPVMVSLLYVWKLLPAEVLLSNAAKEDDISRYANALACMHCMGWM
jgi:hypothetical protein